MQVLEKPVVPKMTLIHRHEAQVEKIDLNSELKSVLKENASFIKDSELKITYAQLPNIVWFKECVERLFVNLVFMAMEGDNPINELHFEGQKFITFWHITLTTSQLPFSKEDTQKLEDWVVQHKGNLLIHPKDASHTIYNISLPLFY